MNNKSKTNSVSPLMLLKKCHFFLMATVTLLMLFVTVSCSDSDSPTFSKMPSRADVVGAKSLVLSPGGQSRADDGDYMFQEAGLYKVDEDGNVSAVGVFMNEEGGTREKEGRIIPRSITKLSDRFVLLVNCKLKFDGDYYYLDYEDIIVDLTTGKIYGFNDFRSFARSLIFSNMVSDSHFLIWEKSSKILGELNINNANATYRQLTNDEGKGFINPGDCGYVNQLPNGVILSQRRWSSNMTEEYHNMGILYPNRGYDYLQDHEKEFLPDNVNSYSYFSFVLKDKAAILYKDHVNDYDKGYPKFYSWSFIEFGTTPGNINVIPTDELFRDFNDFYLHCYGYYETENNIIISVDSLILIFNKQSNKLSEFTPSFPEIMNIYPYAYYKGRVWDISTTEGAQGVKVLWINPDTRESGSFDLDLQGVDVDKIEHYYDSGKVVLYGTRRSDAAYVVATLDLETEKTEIEFSLPKQETITLVPLN